MKCLLCNEERGIQKCHIITRQLDSIIKQYSDFENYLYLCPNHHWYFDKGLLTKEEFNLIKEKVVFILHRVVYLLEDYYLKIEKIDEQMDLILKNKSSISNKWQKKMYLKAITRNETVKKLIKEVDRELLKKIT